LPTFHKVVPLNVIQPETATTAAKVDTLQESVCNPELELIECVGVFLHTDYPSHIKMEVLNWLIDYE